MTALATETRLEIVAHAIRWSSNMLAEVAQNHSVVLPPAAREHLKAALLALSDTAAALYVPGPGAGSKPEKTAAKAKRS